MIDWQPWREALSNKRFRIHLTVTISILILIALFIPFFFHQIIQPKPGLQLNDALLNYLTPRDWSALIFILIYASVGVTIASNLTKPYSILTGLEAYVAINLTRMVTLYLVTLEPPLGMIPLIDPLMDKVAYGGEPFAKDLFFSGHTASLFLLFLVETRRVLKVILLLATLTVASLILWQHVHYTVDVLAAPVIAWGAFKMTLNWLQKIGGDDLSYKLNSD